MRALVAVLTILAACGDDLKPAQPDAGALDAAPDASGFAACREFAATTSALPVHLSGTLGGADVQSPQMCTTVDAPFGIASAGPDTVISLDGLVAGTAYIVQLRSAADLAFYVVNGCSTMTGPAATECALFVDASSGNEEVGRFVATGTSAYVVVDYYASATPSNQSFTLDVYAEACQNDAACTGGPPVCFHGRCVQCADSFDCPSAAQPRCDAFANTCAAGADQCTADDASEPMDDGPAGAVALTASSGVFAASAQICSTPRSEADFYKFDVASAGESWLVTLTWSGGTDLDLEVYNEAGEELGFSFWEQPEAVQLSYLPVGTYYIVITDFSQTSTVPVAYTLDGMQTSTTGCTTRADCAVDYRNQLFRGNCTAGACVPITTTGLAVGEACDTEDDCLDSLACPDFFFIANADTRSVCAPHCTGNADCATLGSNYVCTTYLATQNFCVQKCTTDDQCPTDPTSQPLSGPWYRLTCQVSTGRCVFQ